MSLGVGLLLLIVVIAPPVMWVGWWLLADVGQAAAYGPAVTKQAVPQQRQQPAA